VSEMARRMRRPVRIDKRFTADGDQIRPALSQDGLGLLGMRDQPHGQGLPLRFPANPLGIDHLKSRRRWRPQFRRCNSTSHPSRRADGFDLARQDNGLIEGVAGGNRSRHDAAALRFLIIRSSQPIIPRGRRDPGKGAVLPQEPPAPNIGLNSWPDSAEILLFRGFFPDWTKKCQLCEKGC